MVKVLCAVVVALLVAAAPASAASRSSAQRFADVFERGKSGIVARQDAIEARLVEVEAVRCLRLLPKVGGKEIPDRAFEAFSPVFGMAVEAQMLRVAAPVFARMQADLDAIRTRDRVLWEVRAKWRPLLRLLGQLPQVDDGCARMEAWARSGYAEDRVPAVPTDVLFKLADPLFDGDVGRELEHAVKHLRRRGVARDDAERITGWDLLDGLDAPFEAQVQLALPPEARDEAIEEDSR